MCKERGWHTWLYPVEIGARGFPSQSLWRMLRDIGVRGAQRKRAVGKLSQAAERASSWLWYKKDEKSWKPSTDA